MPVAINTDTDFGEDSVVSLTVSIASSLRLYLGPCFNYQSPAALSLIIDGFFEDYCSHIFDLKSYSYSLFYLSQRLRFYWHFLLSVVVD